jgi:hypothetical protein
MNRRMQPGASGIAALFALSEVVENAADARIPLELE